MALSLSRTGETGLLVGQVIENQGHEEKDQRRSKWPWPSRFARRSSTGAPESIEARTQRKHPHVLAARQAVQEEDRGEGQERHEAAASKRRDE